MNYGVLIGRVVKIGRGNKKRLDTHKATANIASLCTGVSVDYTVLWKSEDRRNWEEMELEAWIIHSLKPWLIYGKEYFEASSAVLSFFQSDLLNTWDGKGLIKYQMWLQEYKPDSDLQDSIRDLDDRRNWCR